MAQIMIPYISTGAYDNLLHELTDPDGVFYELDKPIFCFLTDASHQNQFAFVTVDKKIRIVNGRNQVEKDAIAALQSTMRSVQTSIQVINTSIAQKQQLIDIANDLIADTQSDLSTQKTRITATETEIAGLNQRVDNSTVIRWGNDTSRVRWFGTTSDKVSEIPVRAGNVVFVKDTREVCVDDDEGRKYYSDIITLNTEAQRLALSTPLTGFYFVEDTGILWRYNNKWTALTTPPENQIVFADYANFPQVGKEYVIYVDGVHTYRYVNGEYKLTNPIKWEEI